MFNIKNKIYVKHIDKFAPHEGDFILLDGGKFTEVYFPEDTNFLFRYDSFHDMIKVKFNGNISEFWEYINNIDKLRIYTADNSDYAMIFLYTLKELFSTFGEISQENLISVLDMYEVSDFVQENRDIKYSSMIDAYSNYQHTGKLYSSNSIQSVPLEFIMIMYKNNIISKELANIKIVNLAGPLLQDYTESQLQPVVALITRNFDVLEEYLNVSGVDSLLNFKKAIDTNVFLKKIMCDSIIDINSDLNEIIELFSLAYNRETDTAEDDHIKELMIFVNLFKSPDIDFFISNFENICTLSFFSSRYLKFNDFVLKHYAV